MARAHLLLQSATGNTRLLAERALARFSVFDLETTIQDIARSSEGPPDPATYDLLGVACPVMYFRPAFAMTEFLARLPVCPGAAKPAFVLVSCGGETGATLPMLQQALTEKNYKVVGGKWVPAPDSWPVHRRFVAPLQLLTEPTRLALRALGEPLLGRLIASLWWPDAVGPVTADVNDLDAFLDGLAVRLVEGAPMPEARLNEGLPPLARLGQRMRRVDASKATAPKSDPVRCIRCKTCIAVCPSGSVTLDKGESRPRFAKSCTGCWACFNHCPTRAISGWLTPKGAGQYRGPSDRHRQLFRAR